MHECELRLSRFRSDSLVALLDRRAAFEPVRVDEDTFELFEACARVHRASGGAFDVTVAPAMDDPLATERVGAGAIELDRGAGTVRLRRVGTRLDFGAVGKGHAIDLAVRVLRDAGIEVGLMQGGTSTVFALGSPPGQDGWQVALEHGAGAPVVRLVDEALSVSAAHGRRLADGRTHVLDPRTGEAAQGTFAACVSGSACVADAWSTALLVLGRAPDTTAGDDISTLVGHGPREARTWTAGGRRPEAFSAGHPLGTLP